MNMNMFDSSKLMSRFFRKVENVVWDMTTGKLGVVTDDGIASLSGSGDDAEVNINPFDSFGMTVPAFAQNTPTENVQLGDLIYSSSENSKWCGWVIKRNTKSFTILKPDGTHTTWSSPKTLMIGFGGGVMVLRSLINMLPNGATDLGGMTSMLMPLMMMGGDMSSIEDMMPMMLMSQMGNTPATDEDGKTVPNPFGMMGSNGMMQTMMMMQMMKSMSSNSYAPLKSNGRRGPKFFDDV